MQGYPNVLRGLGLAMAVSFPSCAIATCRHLDLGPPNPDATATILVDRKVTPHGTELCITQALAGGGEPYTVRFNMRRPGEGWKQFFLANDSFWIAEIKLLPDERISIVNDFGERLFFDGRNGHQLGIDDFWPANGTPIDDPFAPGR